MRIGFAITCALLSAVPSAASPGVDWTMMSATKASLVAKGRMKVTPANAWNRYSYRPSKRGESWTRDGISLNELTFFAGIRPGETLFSQGFVGDKKLPRFNADMLFTDLVELFESSNRILLQSSVFQVEKTEPAKLGQHDAVRFRYSYAVQEEDLPRKGEAVAAIVNGELHLVNFVAPTLYFFDRDIEEVRKMIASVELIPAAAK
jgi:hypothetical protein